jgi:hypothetical protein
MEHLDVSDHRGTSADFAALARFVRQSPGLKAVVFDGLGPHPGLHRFLKDMLACHCASKISFPSRDMAALLATDVITKSDYDALLRAFGMPGEAFYLQNVRVFQYETEERVPLWMTAMAEKAGAGSRSHRRTSRNDPASSSDSCWFVFETSESRDVESVSDLQVPARRITQAKAKSSDRGADESEGRQSDERSEQSRGSDSATMQQSEVDESSKGRSGPPP